MTKEGHSDGIKAKSEATGDATALTVVQNSGNITTLEHRSSAIEASSYASGGIFSGNATAKTYVFNTAALITKGSHSKGIKAYAGAELVSGVATAKIDVTNSGSIITYGRHADGISAYIKIGAVGGNGTATIGIENSGLVETNGRHSTAIYAGIYSDPTLKQIAIVNSGDVGALGEGHRAIETDGAPTLIINSPTGVIQGNIWTSFNQMDVFNNSGLWNMVGNSRFGGKGVINNYGTVAMKYGRRRDSQDLATFGVDFRTVTLNGVAAFNNTGLVTFNSPGTVFGGANQGDPTKRIVVANYDGKSVFFNGGSGSTLLVNAFLGAPPVKTKHGYVITSVADVLQVGGIGKGRSGAGYVTGATKIVVNDVAPGLPGAFNPVGIPVAESSGAVLSGTNVASNFTLANGPIQKGFFEYNLFYLPGTQQNACAAGFNCWFLASTPGTAAEEFTQFNTAANDIWREAAGLWLDRTADLRDYFLYSAGTSCDARGGGADLPVKARPCVPIPGAVGPGVWLRGYGDWIKNNNNPSFGAFGQTIGSGATYNQNIGGVQMGADWALMRAPYSVVLVGLLGGASESTVNFASGTKVKFQGGDAGAYATFINHGFFVDALFMGNWMSADYTSSGIPFVGLGFSNLGQNVDLQQYGGRIDGGYRFQFNPWFFEPQVTAEIVHTNWGTFNFPQVATTINVSNDTEVAGRLGGRVGTTWLTGWGRIEPSVFGGVWENFQGNNGAVLTNNGFATDLAASNVKTVGEVGGLLNFFQTGNTMSAFLKGEYRFGDSYNSGSVEAGVRYQWP